MYHRTYIYFCKVLAKVWMHCVSYVCASMNQFSSLCGVDVLFVYTSLELFFVFSFKRAFPRTFANIHNILFLFFLFILLTKMKWEKNYTKCCILAASLNKYTNWRENTQYQIKSTSPQHIKVGIFCLFCGISYYMCVFTIGTKL